MKTRTVYIPIILVLLSVTIVGMLSAKNRVKELDGLNAEVSTLNLYYLNITDQYNFAGDITLSNEIPGTIVLSDVEVKIQAFDTIVNTTFKVPDIITLQSGESRIIHVPEEPFYTQEAYHGNYIENASKTWDFKVKLTINGHATTNFFDGPFEASGKQSRQTNTPDPNPKYVYFGALDNFHGPTWSQWVYQPTIHGILGSAEIPTVTISLGGISYLRLTMSRVRTLTLNQASSLSTYFLVFGTSPPSIEDVLPEYMDSDMVYVYGRLVNYHGPDGTWYPMLYPYCASRENIGDPVESARKYITSIIGEGYFGKYFSEPQVYNPPSEHLITYNYNITIGNYSVSPNVYFDLGKNFSIQGSTGIPSKDNLQPYNVTRERAVEIAVKAGVPTEPFGISASIDFRESYREPKIGCEGKYIWVVKAWLEPGSVPDRMYREAYIDPIDGRVYAVLDQHILKLEDTLPDS